MTKKPNNFTIVHLDDDPNMKHILGSFLELEIKNSYLYTYVFYTTIQAGLSYLMSERKEVGTSIILVLDGSLDHEYSTAHIRKFCDILGNNVPIVIFTSDTWTIKRELEKEGLEDLKIQAYDKKHPENLTEWIRGQMKISEKKERRP